MNEMSASTLPPRTSKPGEPAWEVAYLFPPQGEWTEAAYLALYAASGISEYWIVVPQEERITVLALEGQSYGAYRMHGVFGPGTTATSVSAQCPVFSVQRPRVLITDH